MPIKLSELQQITVTEQQPMSAGEVVGQAITNIPSSALQYGKDIVTPLLDPIGTAKSLVELGAGIVQLAIPGEQANEQQARAVGQYFANRYGGFENLKQTIAKDPVGFLGDASIILTGGGALATRVGPLAKTAEKVKSVGQAIDPLTGKVTQTLVGAPISAVLGTTTGVGREAVSEAYQSSVAGGERAQAFKEGLRGKAKLEDIVEEGKKGVSEMASQRKSQYLRSMEGVKASKKTIDFDPIKKDVLNIRKDFEFKGQTTLDSSGLKKLEDIEDAINIWSENKSFHTVEGLDALKHKIDNLMPEADTFGKTSGKGAAIVTDARNIINNKIKEASPGYANTMKAYEDAINLEKEIRTSLSLGKQSSADTALRKLLSVMRNNTNTNFGVRLENLKKLEESGNISLKPTLAGVSLGQLQPRGIQAAFTPYGLAGAGYGFGILSPEFAALTAASSPRIVGEAAYLAGQTLPKTSAIRQTGVVSEQADQDNNNQTLNLLKKLLQ